MKPSRIQKVESCNDCNQYLSEIDGKHVKICLATGKVIPARNIIVGTFPNFCKLESFHHFKALTDIITLEKEDQRKLFEADAEPYGFDITRGECICGNPRCDYLEENTGNRWAGWMAAKGIEP
jgi:hypothetical protein